MAPAVQTQLLDVASWRTDVDFEIFPQGAREKGAVFAPDVPPDPALVAGKRYLFKRSKRSYPDQFWGEVIAYRIGCLLSIEVPPAFAAVNSATGYCGALIEWFYDEGRQRFVWAGEFLQNAFPGFDRSRGSTHNMHDNAALIRTFIMSEQLSFESDWRQWWADALLFDALIGNTDRHQDNWGFIFTEREDHTGCSLAPCFDNGTSLGHELFADRVEKWDEARLAKYVAKGRHHVKWSLKHDPPIQQHLSVLHQALSAWPQTRESIRNRLAFLDQQSIGAALQDLPTIECPVPLSAPRLTFLLRLVNYRLEQLKFALL